MKRKCDFLYFLWRARARERKTIESMAALARMEHPPEGCELFESQVHRDERGASLRLDASPFPRVRGSGQALVVGNAPGTVRGMHVSQGAKRVLVLEGAIFDVLVDLRPGSPSLGRWWGGRIAGSRALHVAPGVAHGYFSPEGSRVLYVLEAGWHQARHDRTIFWRDPTLGIVWPAEALSGTAAVVSAKDDDPRNSLGAYFDWRARVDRPPVGAKPVVLVYGGRGYLGGHACRALADGGAFDVVLGQARCERTGDASLEVASVRPSAVLCAVGKSGSPTSTWHEENTSLSVEHNVTAVHNVAKACAEAGGVRCVVFGTGFVFRGGSDDAPIPDGAPHDPAPGVFYNEMRSVVERTLVRSFGAHLLVLRINYPVTADLDPRGLFGKLSGAKRLHRVPSSVTVVPSLFPLLTPILLNRDATGAVHFCNRGSVSPAEIREEVMGLRGDAEVSETPPPGATACVLGWEGLEEAAGCPVPDVRSALREAFSAAAASPSSSSSSSASS